MTAANNGLNCRGEKAGVREGAECVCEEHRGAHIHDTIALHY